MHKESEYIEIEDEIQVKKEFTKHVNQDQTQINLGEPLYKGIEHNISQFDLDELKKFDFPEY